MNCYYFCIKSTHDIKYISIFLKFLKDKGYNIYPDWVHAVGYLNQYIESKLSQGYIYKLFGDCSFNSVNGLTIHNGGLDTDNIFKYRAHLSCHINYIECKFTFIPISIF